MRLRNFLVASFSLALLIDLGLGTSYAQELLHGQVQEQNELMRVPRPDNGLAPADGIGDSTRLTREPPVAPSRLKSSLVDTDAFSKPLAGEASQFQGNPGVAQSAAKLPNNFDIGADANSRELLVAWDRWHHQLSQEIYTRWSKLASSPGQAVVRITVTRDRSVQAQMVKSSGDPNFDRSLLDALFSLNGNPGLTFPGQSQRRSVSMESEYVVGYNVQPGFSWVKNDYEKVRQDY